MWWSILKLSLVRSGGLRGDVSESNLDILCIPLCAAETIEGLL